MFKSATDKIKRIGYCEDTVYDRWHFFMKFESEKALIKNIDTIVLFF